MIDPQTAPPGTKVVCTDAGGAAQGILVVGQVYEVDGWRSMGSTWEVLLKGPAGTGHTTASWMPRRFDLAPVSTTPPSIPVFNAGLQNSTQAIYIPHFFYNGAELDEEPVTPALVPICAMCKRDLCAELDSYWGPHHFLKDYCSKCRRQFEPKGANRHQYKEED